MSQKFLALALQIDNPPSAYHTYPAVGYTDVISPNEADKQMMIKHTATQPHKIVTGPPPVSGYISVVASPYGTEDNMKDINATEAVVRVR